MVEIFRFQCPSDRSFDWNLGCLRMRMISLISNTIGSFARPLWVVVFYLGEDQIERHVVAFRTARLIHHGLAAEHHAGVEFCAGPLNGVVQGIQKAGEVWAMRWSTATLILQVWYISSCASVPSPRCRTSTVADIGSTSHIIWIVAR